MKKGKYGWSRAAVLGMAMVMVIALGGCGSSDSYKADDYNGYNAAADFAPVKGGMSSGGTVSTADQWAEAEYDYEAPSEMVSPAVDNSAYYVNRKLIRTVNLDVETKEFDQMLSSLEEQVNLLGGYIENMSSYNGSKYSSNRDPIRNANMTIRVPKQQLDGFLETISSVGNVISRSENVEDVTLAYVDIESHKDALSTEQKRLLELLDRAETMEDILVIEDRLTTVRYQLETMESQLRTYDNKVDFSTVYLTIREVKELTPVKEETVLERIGNGFMDNLRDVGEGLLEFLIWLIVHLPKLLLIAVIVGGIVWIVKLIIRSSKKKKAAKEAQMQQAAQGRPMQGQPMPNQPAPNRPAPAQNQSVPMQNGAAQNQSPMGQQSKNPDGPK